MTASRRSLLSTCRFTIPILNCGLPFSPSPVRPRTSVTAAYTLGAKRASTGISMASPLVSIRLTWYLITPSRSRVMRASAPGRLYNLAPFQSRVPLNTWSVPAMTPISSRRPDSGMLTVRSPPASSKSTLFRPAEMASRRSRSMAVRLAKASKQP